MRKRKREAEEREVTRVGCEPDTEHGSPLLTSLLRRGGSSAQSHGPDVARLAECGPGHCGVAGSIPAQGTCV